MNFFSNLKTKLFRTKLDLEIYWASVYAASIRGDDWLNKMSVNSGRWGPNFSLLYILTRCLKAAKPTHVLELGLGEVTEILLHYRYSLNPGSKVLTVEHDDNWASYRKPLLFNNGESLDLLMLPLEHRTIRNKQTLAYKGLAQTLNAKGLRFDLVVIDGPFGSKRFSRINVLDLVDANLLQDDFIIIMDDCNRRGEAETAKLLCNQFKDRGIDIYSGYFEGEKGQLIITTKKFQFLTTV